MPAEVFRLAPPQIELFLGRLWSGDGFVGAAGQMPFYATSSLQLASDVQMLLLRLGLVARVASKLLRYRYKGVLRERPAYTVHLVGDQSVRTFVARLGPHMIGRGDQVAAYRAYLDSVAPATSKDTIPPGVRAMVDDHRRAARLGWRELEAQSGVSMREFATRSSTRKQGFRRATIARLASFFESQRLREVAESDIYWDRVESIEPAGVGDVYDLTVDHNHNFVADGLIVHNSHSTAYASIAYMTAYLKAHYPIEFMAALLSCDIPGRNFKSKDALVEHLEDCRRMEIDVRPPDVNACDRDFKVQDGKIHFGLSAVKACGAGAAEAIVAARNAGGLFTSVFDFCERVDPQQCGRATIEALVKAGALDSLGGHRAACLAVLDRALQSGAAAAADRRSGQKGLFGDDEPATTAAPALPDVPPWSEKEKLAAEKEVLGYYLTSHPLAEFAPTLRMYCSHSTPSLAGLAHRDEVLLGGMLASIKYSHTKNPRQGGTNTKYAMWDLEDLDGIVRCILWPEQFAQHSALVQPDAIVAVKGKVDRRPGAEEINVIVDELIPLADLADRFSSGIVIRLSEAEHGERALEQLREILRGYPGSKKLRLGLDLAAGGQLWLESSSLRVEAHPELRQRIEALLGPNAFHLQAAAPRPSSPPRPTANTPAAANPPAPNVQFGHGD